MTQTPQARPLSPHIQIYRPQLTSGLSIAHRISGLGLSFGLVMLTWFFYALAAGPGAYATFESFAGSLIGRLMLMAWSFALFFHLCAGVRHLIFDTGHLFNIRHAYLAGYAVIFVSLVMTAALWLLTA